LLEEPRGKKGARRVRSGGQSLGKPKREAPEASVARSAQGQQREEEVQAVAEVSPWDAEARS